LRGLFYFEGMKGEKVIRRKSEWKFVTNKPNYRDIVPIAMGKKNGIFRYRTSIRTG
jgi:hypothetical protein